MDFIPKSDKFHYQFHAVAVFMFQNIIQILRIAKSHARRHDGLYWLFSITFCEVDKKETDHDFVSLNTLHWKCYAISFFSNVLLLVMRALFREYLSED